LAAAVQSPDIDVVAGTPALHKAVDAQQQAAQA
jgi:hypothetical protein